MKGVWTILLCPACGTRPARTLRAFRGSRSCPIGPIEPLQGALSGCLALQRVGLFSPLRAVPLIVIVVADRRPRPLRMRTLRAGSARPFGCPFLTSDEPVPARAAAPGFAYVDITFMFISTLAVIAGAGAKTTTRAWDLCTTAARPNESPVVAERLDDGCRDAPSSSLFHAGCVGCALQPHQLRWTRGRCRHHSAPTPHFANSVSVTHTLEPRKFQRVRET